jgi:hypothetical protein
VQAVFMASWLWSAGISCSSCNLGLDGQIRSQHLWAAGPLPSLAHQLKAN